MQNGVYLKYFLSYPVKYEKHQAEKIKESFEKGLKKSLPRHVFDDEKTAKMFKVELKASEPCAYAISALKSYGFDKSDKLDKPVYYGVFDFGGGTTDFDFGKWEKSTSPKFSYKMTHFSNGGDKYLGGNASRSVLVKQAFENAKEKQLKDYKQKTSKDDFTFILYEPLGTEKSDKQILELTGEDISKIPPYLKATCKTGVAFGLLESRPKAGGIERLSISSNPVFKYDLGIEREGKFHTKIHRDSLKPNEYQIFQTKEEWGGFDELEIRYSDKALANTNTLDIEYTQLIFIALEEHEEVDVKVCCVDSQSIKVGLFKDDQLIYESEAEKL